MPSTMDLTVDNSEDRRATEMLKRGTVVLLCFGAPYESLYVRRKKGIDRGSDSERTVNTAFIVRIGSYPTRWLGI